MKKSSTKKTVATEPEIKPSFSISGEATITPGSKVSYYLLVKHNEIVAQLGIDNVVANFTVDGNPKELMQKIGNNPLLMTVIYEFFTYQ